MLYACDIINVKLCNLHVFSVLTKDCTDRRFIFILLTKKNIVEAGPNFSSFRALFMNGVFMTLVYKFFMTLVYKFIICRPFVSVLYQTIA